LEGKRQLIAAFSRGVVLCLAQTGYMVSIDGCEEPTFGCQLPPRSDFMDKKRLVVVGNILINLLSAEWSRNWIMPNYN
jgi:hypothetical protein